MTPGASLIDGGTRFVVRARDAAGVWLCLFDGDSERRVAMTRDGDWFVCDVAGVGPGQRYGYRAEGEWAPHAGRWFDPAKLLIDPYAVELDRRFAYDPALSQFGADTAAIVPRAIVTAATEPVRREPPRIDPARPGAQTNAAERSCLAEVGKRTGTRGTSVIASRREGPRTIVDVGVRGAIAPWRCTVGPGGRVIDVMFMGDEGAL